MLANNRTGLKWYRQEDQGNHSKNALALRSMIFLDPGSILGRLSRGVTMKRCYRCKETMSIDSFSNDRSRKDGKSGRCRKCDTTVKANYRKRNSDKSKAYNGEYCLENANKLRKNKAEQRENNNEKYKKLDREWYSRHRERELLRKRNYRNSNPEKINAYDLLAQAIRLGKISKPDRCSSCKTVGQILGHHEDYNKPLDVIWLCSKCHMRLHASKNRESGKSTKQATRDE